jgi:hypothetical protein
MILGAGGSWPDHLAYDLRCALDQNAQEENENV